MRLRFLLFFTFFYSSLFYAEGSLNELMDALEIAQYWDEQTYERFPVTYDHLLSTGYFVTHSARMTAEGEIGIGIAHVPPYLLWNGRIQPFDRLEFSANYRIFKGVEDQGLSPHGFGDYADRGANFKYALITPEDSEYILPGLAFGIDDFMGSKKFTTYFIVGTQVWRKYALETSFGWGSEFYTKGPSRGFFGGFNWFPFFKCPNKWFEGICLSAEYDPTNYNRDPHPDGRHSNSPINFGLKYQLKGFLDLSTSYIRGEEFAAAGSLSYNFADFEGFIPKIGDPVPYVAPVNYEPLGCYRPENVMIQDLSYALDEQGFQLIEAHLDGECLWLSLINCRYRQEHCVRMRLQHLLASLMPENIETITVIIESYGLPCQQYVYSRELLMRYTNHSIGPYEFDILTPREGAHPPFLRCKDDLSATPRPLALSL